MPQLDRLLSVLVSNRADSLQLVENELAALVKGGTTHPLTKQALAAPQLLGLLREIAPPDAVRRLDQGTPAEFHYRTGDGVFHARASNEGGKWIAAITTGEAPAGARAPGSAAASTNGVGRPLSVANGRVPTGSSTAVPDTASVTVTASAPADDPMARTAIENLLRQLVEQSGSDLHLRCGEPPILRRHGEMVRLSEHAPLDDATLRRMLVVLMPERNREEYSTRTTRTSRTRSPEWPASGPMRSASGRAPQPSSA